MERIRHDHPRPADAAGGAVTLPPPATDVARVARDALAPVPAEAPATLAIRVKTGGGRAAEIVATPDTTVGELLGRACEDLGVEDGSRYALVAMGELLGDPDQSIEALAHESIGSELTMRLVRKPEAGGRRACRS
jgi:hypothetical protein